MAENSDAFRIGCDIGGTFTDFILLNEETGQTAVEKVLTTPADPSDAVLEGCNRFTAATPGIIGNTKHMIHGTTLVINAVLERKGARTGLLTSNGFRDVLEMRRYMRADMYDVFGDLPEPLIPRECRLGIDERIYADGRVLAPLDDASVSEAVDHLVDHGVTSVAVCLLHSFTNNAHERKVAEIIRRDYPQLDVSISSEILPRISEYERTSTVAVNAYVKPIVRNYLSRLEERLREAQITYQLFLMVSGGGIISVETAQQYPVRLVESGPVAGVLAAARFGELADATDVLSFDMGGTTAKASLIQSGQIPIASDYEVARTHRFRRGSGIPISLPTVNIIEVGTGGGSIAYIDELGLVKVGPKSAGADPGPACYGRGGTEPTVTDADVILGYLNPEYFLGGTMSLDREAAHRAIEDRIATPLGMSVPAAAWGIVDVAREQMSTAMRMHIAERAGDPGRTTVVASGGAGPVHAMGLLRKLGASQAVFPLGAGVMSALGMLMAPVSYNLVQTYKADFRNLDWPELERGFQNLESEGRSILASADPIGTPTFIRSVDMRYVGQGHELSVTLPDEPLSVHAQHTVLHDFHTQYGERYGYVSYEDDVEIVNLQVRAIIEDEPLAIPRISPSGRSLADAVKGAREAFDPDSQSYVQHAVYDRYLLDPGSIFAGPAIVEERESTVVIGEGYQALVDEYGSLIVHRRQQGG